MTISYIALKKRKFFSRWALALFCSLVPILDNLPHEGESGALMRLEKSVVAMEPRTVWWYHKWEEIGMATSKNSV